MRKPNANTYALFPIAWLLVSGAGCLAGTVSEPGSFARNFMVYGLGAGAIVASLAAAAYLLDLRSFRRHEAARDR